MPRHTFKTPVPQIKIHKPNYQNIMIIVVFVVGGFLVYRMISSVQRQLLVLKRDVSNLKEQKSKPQQIMNPSCGFEVSFQTSDGAGENALEDQDPLDQDDEVSIDSVDIEKIMKKLTAPEEHSVKDGSQFKDLGCNQQHHQDCDHHHDNSKGDHNVDDDSGLHTGKKDNAEEETDHETLENATPSTEKIVEIHEDLSKTPIADIKKMLKEKGLSTKGNKAQLIAALNESRG